MTLTICALALLARCSLVSPLALAYTPSSPTLHSLLACHFAHFSDLHLAWDALTFAALGFFTERMQRARFALFLLAAIAFVPPLACALEPWVRHYAGLSGLVIGQVALALAGALRAALARRARVAATCAGCLLALLFAKQLYEYGVGNTSLITLHYRGFSTVPGAHLISAAIGALVGLSSAAPAERPDSTAEPSGTRAVRRPVAASPAQ